MPLQLRELGLADGLIGQLLAQIEQRGGPKQAALESALGLWLGSLQAHPRPTVGLGQRFTCTRDQ